MEMNLNNGFCEMSQDEMLLVDGGFFADAWNEVCKGVTAMAAGAIAGAKVGAVTCTPVGAVAGVVVGAVAGVAWDHYVK